MLHLRTFLVLCLTAFFAGVTGAGAADPTISATLSQTVVGVGESVQLQIKISGARGIGQPPKVEVEGLDIRYLGPSQNTVMRLQNGQFVSESSVTYIYSIDAPRAGSFMIPSVAVPVDGRTLRTESRILKVQQDAPATSNEQRALGELEIVLPRKTAYVGETIPVEIRLSVDSRVRWEPERMPELTGDGFTKQKIPEPRQERGRKDGREVDVLVFRTAITPGRAGKITLGPIEVPYIALVPRAQRNRPRSLFDLLDDGVFADPFFAERQRFQARAAAVEIEVKPLPAAGQPRGFSGAVGQFKFAAEGSPRQVKIGDPVTMKLTVSGRGNFDRIEVPALTDRQGWRTYPPAVNFKADDELGVRGTKTFDVAVIPEVKKSAMPEFEFSYFDPEQAKYVTLKSEPAPLVVEGGAPPPPPPPPAGEPASESVAPAAAPEVTDILGIRYDQGRGAQSFEPLYRQRGFLLAQLVPLAALFALLGAKFLRGDPGAGRAAALRKERATLLSKLQRGDLAEPEFFETAARVIQLDTALITGGEPGSVDAATASRARGLDHETAQAIDDIFSARAELLYAGGGVGDARLPAETRSRVLKTVEKFSHARS